MRKYILATALGLAAIAASDCAAVKAWPGMLKATDAEGNTIEYRMVGDEIHHAMVSADGFALRRLDNGCMMRTELFDSAAFDAEHRRKSAARKRVGGMAFPTTGNLKGIVILVEFADNAFQPEYTREVFHDVMNKEGFSAYNATGSARDYFIDQSNGKFTPDFDVVGPVKLSRAMMHYGQNNSFGEDAYAYEMVTEACKSAEQDLGVDFSRYDFDGDGTVDFVYVIYAGYAESYGASSNTIWPHASLLSSRGIECEVSGVKVDRYACSGELKFVSGTTLEGIGTFCHEFSHVLGLPDMYNTRYPSALQLGAWDVMDQGNYNNDSHTPPSYSAFERESLGWMEIQELDTPADRVELPEMTTSGIAYRVSSPVEGEYFTLENRQQSGWDRFQPGRGLMIIHIAYEQSAWDGNFVNSGIINRYDLVEADGTQGAGEASDLFPYGGKDAFTDYTVPSSQTWDGQNTSKGITMIKDEDGLITFRFMKDRLKTPQNLTATDIKSDSFTLTWDPVEDADTYHLMIDEILPDELNPVIAIEDFSGMTAGGYPTSDPVNISDSLDKYLFWQGCRGTEVYQAGGRMLIGRYGASGNFTSPLFEIPAGVESLTVAADVVGYPAKSVNYTIELTDVSGKSVAKFSDKANKQERTAVLNATRFPEKVAISVSTTNERLFIDRIALIKGEVEEADIWNLGPRHWDITGINSTDYRLEGLAPERSYTVVIEAEPAAGMHASIPSEMLTVTTSEPTSVGAVEGTATLISTMVHDILGRPCKADEAGIKIVTRVWSDGTVTTSKQY